MRKKVCGSDMGSGKIIQVYTPKKDNWVIDELNNRVEKYYAKGFRVSVSDEVLRILKKEMGQESKTLEPE